MFKSQRINDTVYVESGDGRIKLVYPYKSSAQVKGLIDAAELMLPENDPQLQLGQLVPGTELAEHTFGRIRQIAKIANPAEKKPKKHRDAKVLRDDKGVEFKLADYIEAKTKAVKGGKVSIAETVEELKHHYNGNVHNTRNAIRISAMQSERFSIANDWLVMRVPTAGGKKAS